jgi:hypothetical protein
MEVLEYHPVTNSYEPIVDIVYDAEGKIKNTKKQGLSQANYTYYNDSIKLDATDILGNDISTTYYLDNKQRIIKTDFFNYDYTYNDDGYLVSFKQPYGYNGQITGYNKYYLTYENGNLKEVYSDLGNGYTKQITMEYYAEPNQILMG